MECQQKFFEVTENTSKLSSCFQSATIFKLQSKEFFKKLNGTFHQCFRKVRITDKTQKKKDDGDGLSKFLNIKSKLQTFMKETKSETVRLLNEKYICKLDENIMRLSAEKNANIIKEHISHFQTPEGSFSQTGLWNQKKITPPSNRSPHGKERHGGKYNNQA